MVTSFNSDMKVSRILCTFKNKSTLQNTLTLQEKLKVPILFKNFNYILI